MGCLPGAWCEAQPGSKASGNQEPTDGEPGGIWDLYPSALPGCAWGHEARATWESALAAFCLQGRGTPTLICYSRVHDLGLDKPSPLGLCCGLWDVWPHS